MLVDDIAEFVTREGCGQNCPDVAENHHVQRRRSERQRERQRDRESAKNNFLKLPKLESADL